MSFFTDLTAAIDKSEVSAVLTWGDLLNLQGLINKAPDEVAHPFVLALLELSDRRRGSPPHRAGAA